MHITYIFASWIVNCELKYRKYLKYLRVCNLLSSYCYFDCIHLYSINYIQMIAVIKHLFIHVFLFASFWIVRISTTYFLMEFIHCRKKKFITWSKEIPKYSTNIILLRGSSRLILMGNATFIYFGPLAVKIFKFRYRVLQMSVVSTWSCFDAVSLRIIIIIRTCDENNWKQIDARILFPLRLL